jgi:hypothetical protein
MADLLPLRTRAGIARFAISFWEDVVMKTKFFPDTGHRVNRSKSKEVNQAIREFLGTTAQ